MQQLCAIHKKQIEGICLENVCKYQTRLLCSSCHFTHQKCSKKLPITTFQSYMQYILNPEMHLSNCTYFQKNSPIQVFIDESINKLKDSIKKQYLELELKQLEVILMEQGDSRWAYTLLNLKNQAMQKQEYDAAVTMIRTKQKFDEKIQKDLKKMLEQYETLITNNIQEEMKQYSLQNVQYDPLKIYQSAQETIKKKETVSLSLPDFQLILKNKRYTQLKGHKEQQAVIAIIDADTHIVTGSDDGLIIGWHKQNYMLDYRIQSNDGLSSLAVAKLQDSSLLFAGGQGQIQSFNLKTKQKLYSLHGHRLQITKMKAHSLRYLISASQDGNIKLWDLQERQAIKTFSYHNGPVTDFVIDRDLVSVGQDGIVNYIDINSQVLKNQLKLKVPIFSICIIKQNKYALALGNGSIRIMKGQSKKDFQISEEVIWKVISINKKLIICLSQDGYLNLIDIKQNRKPYKQEFVNECLWQDIGYIDNKLIIPQKGNIYVYK